MSITFKNFEAASRRRNIQPFALLRADTSITWIDDNPAQTSTTVVPFSATPNFEATDGYEQTITVTGDITSSSITYLGLSTVPSGMAMSIRWQIDAVGGYTISLPPTLLIDPTYKIDTTASTVTRWDLISNAATQKWEFLAPPVIYPAN